MDFVLTGSFNVDPNVLLSQVAAARQPSVAFDAGETLLGVPCAAVASDGSGELIAVLNNSTSADDMPCGSTTRAPSPRRFGVAARP